MPSEQRALGSAHGLTCGDALAPGSRCLRSGGWAPTAGRNQSATRERGPAGAGDVARLPEGSQRRATPCPRTWGGQQEAVGASPSWVTPQSPEKREMAVSRSKRKEKERKKLDGFMVLALGGVKRGGARRTPGEPVCSQGTCAMQTVRQEMGPRGDLHKSPNCAAFSGVSPARNRRSLQRDPDGWSLGLSRVTVPRGTQGRVLGKENH